MCRVPVRERDPCYRCNVPLQRTRKKETVRVVPAFSLQALRQKNTKVEQFQGKQMKKPYPVGNTLFKKYYLRGDFPIGIQYNDRSCSISWKVPLRELDYNYFLPMFFNGLCEIEFPYSYFAQEGILEMLAEGRRRVLPAIPRIVTQLKNALDTRHGAVVCAALKSLQALVKSSEAVGEALVPYYRRLLPPLNLYRNFNMNIGDEIDYGQQKRQNIGELVEETLQLLELFGGKHAFVNINYIIPTYQSVIKNI